jgi:hypothetical protein
MLRGPGKGTKWMVLGDGQGIPLGVRLESVSTGEVTLADATLADQILRTLVAGKQLVDKLFIQFHLFLSSIQEQTFTRKSKHPRWTIEHTHAWQKQFRRLKVRYEHLLSLYYVFSHFACFGTTLRGYL